MSLFLPAKRVKKVKKNKGSSAGLVCYLRTDLRRRSGAILIVTLWILTILTLFAIALSQRASMEIQLAEYQRDKLKAVELAKAAIKRAIWEKQNDPVEKVDALSQNWANNEAAFKAYALGQGSFTVSYFFDRAEEEEDISVLYGMEDEEGKININNVEEPVLINLLESCGVEDAERLASSIRIWSGQKLDSGDEEEDYYQALDLPYHCKKEELKTIPELLLVRGITTGVLYGEDKDDDGKISEKEQGIAQYLTIFGSAKVNINTAAENVLSALIDDANLVDEIVLYRKGDDDRIGTGDDRWFSVGEGIVNIEGEPAKNLRAGFSPDPLFDVDSGEWAKLQNLEANGKLGVSSNIYTVYARAEVKKVKKSITATISLSESEPVKFLYWYNN